MSNIARSIISEVALSAQPNVIYVNFFKKKAVVVLALALVGLILLLKFLVANLKMSFTYSRARNVICDMLVPLAMNLKFVSAPQVFYDY